MLLNNLLNNINQNTFTVADANTLLNECEGLGHPPAHPRQHVFSSDTGYPLPLEEMYVQRPKHSMFFQEKHQNKATHSILTSNCAKWALETLLNKGVGSRVAIYIPCPANADIEMIELSKGQPGKKFKPQNITLILDHLAGGVINIQTDYPTEEWPPSITKNLLSGRSLFTVKGVNKLYYIEDNRRFEIDPAAQQLVQYSKHKSIFPSLESGFNYALSDEPILLNGMKVIFDQPAPVYPVNLKRKDK